VLRSSRPWLDYGRSKPFNGNQGHAPRAIYFAREFIKRDYITFLQTNYVTPEHNRKQDYKHIPRRCKK